MNFKMIINLLILLEKLFFFNLKWRQLINQIINLSISYLKGFIRVLNLINFMLILQKLLLEYVLQMKYVIFIKFLKKFPTKDLLYLVSYVR
jgi:hypothetical protein